MINALSVKNSRNSCRIFEKKKEGRKKKAGTVPMQHKYAYVFTLMSRPLQKVTEAWPTTLGGADASAVWLTMCKV